MKIRTFTGGGFGENAYLVVCEDTGASVVIDPGADSPRLAAVITAENIDTFHFHGATSDLPITAIIAVPDSQRSSDLLLGEYQSSEETCQIVRPAVVVADLTDTLFQIEGVLNSAYAGVVLAAVLLVGLVVMLSLRLRRREMQTMFKLGCSRTKVAELLASELAIVGGASIVLVLLMAYITSRFADDIMRGLIL